MKLKKAEVLSVPSNSSYYCIETTSIHACPDSYSYKSTQYITFRKHGGIMERVYKIDEIVILNPHDSEQLSRLSPKYKNRIRLYMDCRERELPFESKDYDRRFYILSETNQIELAHKPHMRKNSQGHCYFTLAELTSGKEIVEVASKQL